jgi:hypothetical protein
MHVELHGFLLEWATIPFRTAHGPVLACVRSR